MVEEGWENLCGGLALNLFTDMERSSPLWAKLVSGLDRVEEVSQILEDKHIDFSLLLTWLCCDKPW